MDGIESKPPRYYDKWMDEHHPDIMAGVRDKRWDEVEQLDDKKLRAKEAIHEARTQLFNGRATV